MRKNEPWKDDPWLDPVIGTGTTSDDDTEHRIRQLDRTPEWREDEGSPPPTPGRLAAELSELGRSLPPPGPRELDTDWAWIQENWGTATLEPYRGRHIAVLGRRVVESDENPLSLRLTWARRLNVHPERLAVVYIPAL